MATIEWAKNWIHDMVGYSNSFPKFMYQDMFLMRDFKGELHPDNIVKNASPLLVSKLEISEIAKFNFPRLK